MTQAIETQDLRNLIASVNLTKALVAKFEEKPFTVGSANSSVKMFSSLVTLYAPIISKLSTKTQAITSKGFGRQVMLSKMNNNFSESFENANEEEVVPSTIVAETLKSYKLLLQSLQIVVAMSSENLAGEINHFTEREITIIDECREVYNKFMENYEDENEALHNFEHKDEMRRNSTSVEKEMALLKNTEIDLGTSNGSDESKPQISADFRIRD